MTMDGSPKPQRDDRAEGGRAQAPGRLALVQALVNTRDIEASRDSIATPGDLATWLRSAGLAVASPAPTSTDVARVQDLREAFRAALEANAHLADGVAATKRLARAADGIELRIGASGDGPILLPAGSRVDAVLGRLLIGAVQAVADGSWQRLKVCRNVTCRWVFWDGSRNRSRAWCDMAVCGNRAKGRTFRRRQAAS
jgi:predicted RNA-binding Zn ribbon-like protein